MQVIMRLETFPRREKEWFLVGVRIGMIFFTRRGSGRMHSRWPFRRPGCSGRDGGGGRVMVGGRGILPVKEATSGETAGEKGVLLQ